MWNSWLGFSPDYKNEIIIDSFRAKGINDFESRMNDIFKELNRVLKKDKYLSFTFHNRDLKVWKAVIEPLLKNGFQLVNVVMQPQAVSSGTQGINKNNTLKGDFIHNFKKVSNPISTSFSYQKDAYTFIREKARNYLTTHMKSSASELYEFLIPEIILNHAFMNENGKVIDIEGLLEKEFTYFEESDKFYWKNKENSNNQINRGVLDLFAGAGGFSTGFKRAGFKIVAAVEFDLEIAETYRKNHPDTKLYSNDIRDLSTTEVLNIFKENNITS